MSSSNDSAGSSKMKNIQSSATQLWSSMTNLRSVEKEQEGGVQATAESVLRVMFGACTTGSRDVVAEEFDMVTPSKLKKTNSSEGNSPEMLYPKDVSEAVEHLQEKQASTSRQSSFSSMKIPGLFPMSTPKTKTVKVQSQDSPVFEHVISEDKTFDDGISSISASTLEDMALAYEAMDGISRMRSDVTQDPHQKVEESWKQTVVRKGGTLREPGMAPICLSRDGRSSNTRYSHQTKSTVSTQSEEFVSVFRRNELDYWNDVAKEDDVRGKPNMKPSDFLKLAQDGTITTVPSSSCSATPTFRKSRLDDDRLLDVLVLPPGTEVAEI